MQKLTRKTLHELRDCLVPEIKIRKPEEKEAYIIVGMGDCGIQKGSKEIFKIISEKINGMGKRGDIAVLQSELAGLCDAEPIVEVILKGEKPVKYGHVTPEIANEIIDSHVVNKKILSKYVFDISKKAGAEV
ncbi:(2Fe-2S) ferredoxin domain-containing protein [Treponema pedis]|uniref:(2Fe-2S) ferredoxin domain-containing protein n=1 Tax=Treponema pedis TaxID=409322 RepID=UPI000422B354|nr:(2Fe-2S) ferredoxin domain-containing protein [Treponema pedis]